MKSGTDVWRRFVHNPAGSPRPTTQPRWFSQLDGKKTMLSDDLLPIRTRLDDLERQVARRPDVPTRATLRDPPVDDPRETWGGGGLVVLHHPPRPLRPEEDPRGRSANCLLVITPHAEALGWLLLELHEAELDFLRLAEAALRYQIGHPELETERGILQALVDEARVMVEEDEVYTAEAPARAAAEEVAAAARRVVAEARAAEQWQAAKLPGPPREGSIWFHPRDGIGFDPAGAYLGAERLDPPQFMFKGTTPLIVRVSLDGDRWIAMAEDWSADWPGMGDDIGGPFPLPVDVLPGSWGPRVEPGEGLLPGPDDDANSGASGPS